MHYRSTESIVKNETGLANKSQPQCGQLGGDAWVRRESKKPSRSHTMQIRIVALEKHDKLDKAILIGQLSSEECSRITR